MVEFERKFGAIVDISEIQSNETGLIGEKVRVTGR
jgi:hypothetical protein